MKINLLKDIKKRVSSFKVLGEELYLVDEENRVLIFSKNLTLKKGFKLKLLPNRPNENSTRFCEKYLAINIKNNVYVFDLSLKKFIAIFKNKFDNLAVNFDDKGRYLLIGDIAGNIFLYNLKAKRVVFKTKHKDFISDLLIRDLEIVAGSYDRAVLFINTILNSKIDRYLHVEKVKKIENKNFLVSADEISDIINWTDENSKDRVDLYEEFRDFFIEKEILIILTNKRVALYDLEKEVFLNKNFLNIEAEKIYKFNNYLLFTNEGKIFYVDLFEDEKEFLDAILKEDFKKAYEFVDKNPFLKYSKGFERLEKLVALFIKRAKALFEVDPLKAKANLSKLLIVPMFRSKIEKIINDYMNLIKFKKAVLENKFSLAYFLLKEYPLLKETKYYKLLEIKWERAFNKALLLIKENKISEAREVLMPFVGVPEKREIIEFILKNATLIFLLREKIMKKDFKGFFSLIKQNPILKNTKEYKKVIEYGEKLYQKALEFVENEEFEKAKEILLILEDFEGFEERVKELKEKIEISLKFLYYLNNKEYKKALKLANDNPFLKRLKSYQEFIKGFSDKLYKAELKNQREEVLNNI